MKEVPIEINLCECDCGGFAKPGNRFIWGHNSPNKGITKEINPNLAWSKERKEKSSKSHIGKLLGITKEINPNLVWPEERKERSRKSHLGITKETNPDLACSEEKKKSLKRANVGKKQSKETIEKRVKKLIGITKKTNPNLIRSKESKERSRKSQIELWQNSEYKEKQLKAIFKASERKPTKPEIQLNEILQNLLPNKCKYVGDGQVIIGYKNPDFIFIDGQKKIIELFGDFWHTKDQECYRIKLFAKYSYKTLIIWENELEDLEKLKKRILQFYIG